MGAQPRGSRRKGRAGRWRPVLLLSLLAVAMGASAAKHDRKREALQAEPRREASSCQGSPDRIIESIERKYRARVVKVNVVEEGGRCVYVLRLLSEEGRVWTVRVDSRGGF